MACTENGMTISGGFADSHILAPIELVFPLVHDIEAASVVPPAAYTLAGRDTKKYLMRFVHARGDQAAERAQAPARAGAEACQDGRRRRHGTMRPSPG